MSKASIISGLQSVLADAQALPEVWPVGMNCLGGAVPVSTAFTPSDFWSSMVTYQARMMDQLRSGWIACLGTSITQGHDVAQVNPACINLGIGGDTMRGLLNRMNGITALNRAGVVVLEIGTNDAGYESFDNISLMLDRIYGWLTGPLVVLSIIPQPGCSIATCDAVNALMQQKLSGRQKCAYVNITTPLRDVDGWMKSSLSIGDRMHPNASGYSIINPLMGAAINSVVA